LSLASEQARKKTGRITRSKSPGKMPPTDKVHTQRSMANSETSAAGSNANDWLSAPAHTLEADVCVKAFKTDVKQGLDNAQVAEYTKIFGENKLQQTPPPSFASILLRNALNGELGFAFLSLLRTHFRPLSSPSCT
jgi:hypothetical protein